MLDMIGHGLLRLVARGINEAELGLARERVGDGVSIARGEVLGDVGEVDRVDSALPDLYRLALELPLAKRSKVAPR